MACPDCGRHSVICGLCMKCLQEHCHCLDAECLKCGGKMIVPKDTRFNGNTKHSFYAPIECDGQVVRKSRFA